MDDLSFAKEPDNVIDVRVIGQAKDVIVGKSSFLLCRQILGQIGYDIACDLHGRGGPRVAGSELRIYASGVVHEIGIESSSLDLLVAQIPSELMDQGAYHLKVPQFFRTWTLEMISSMEAWDLWVQVDLEIVRILPASACVFGIDRLD